MYQKTTQASAHLTLGLAANVFLLAQKVWFLVQLLQLLAHNVYICGILGSSKNLLGFKYLCLDIDYLSVDCRQPTGSSHPDANFT